MANRPDFATRLVSHALVSVGVGYLIADTWGTVPGLVAAMVAAVAHEELDAPLAQLLANGGL
jgi:uncharacterized membrane protein